MTDQEQLTDHVNKLQRLLADPHPGLSTWTGFYAKHMKFISDFWSIEPGEEHLVKVKQAGPELLAACQAAFAAIPSSPGSTTDMEREAMKLLQAAIAKATN